jgi:MazG family protein
MDSSETGRHGGFERLDALLRSLRGPAGCPWDRAQTLRTIVPYLLEEVHELYEAVTHGDRGHVAEEAGDTWFLLTFALQVGEQEGWFRCAEVAEHTEAKLIRRHPHVFQGTSEGSDAPLARWEQIKRGESHAGGDLLRPLPAGLPALRRATRLQEKAAAFGFDWEKAADVFPKILEEVGEVQELLAEGGESSRVEEEVGDLLFAVVNLARHLGQDPEAALHVATEKFRIRFNDMARAVEQEGHRMGEAPLPVLEAHWQNLKARASDSEPRVLPSPREDGSSQGPC